MWNTQEQKAERTKYEEGQRWSRAQSWCLCVSKTCLQTASQGLCCCYDQEQEVEVAVSKTCLQTVSQGLYCYYDQEQEVEVAVAAADTTT